MHQDPSETLSNEAGKATCKPTCEKGSTSECISEGKYQRKCCKPMHFFHCEKREAVNTSLFSAKALSMRDNMTIHGIYFTFKKFVPPSMFVYVTENKEEAHLYYKNKTGNVKYIPCIVILSLIESALALNRLVLTASLFSQWKICFGLQHLR